MAKIITVGDLKKYLEEFPDDLPIIYSHDDEGNEFQRVINQPSIYYIKKQESYRFLRTKSEKKAKGNPNYEKVVCIN